MQRPKRSGVALRSIGAGILVSLLGGPVFLWLLVALIEPPADSEFPVQAGDIATLLYLFPMASIAGLGVSAPAALANAITLIALGRRRVDGLLPAIIAASAWGVAVPVSVFSLLDGPNRQLIHGDHSPVAIACLATTGALLGSIYWLIAVRPNRRPT